MAMSKGILIYLLMVTWCWVAPAQIPRTLQIGATNGIVTLSTQTSPGAFFAWLQTTTNLSPPIVWSQTRSALYQTGVNSNFPAAGGPVFFRLLQQWPVFEFAIFYNLNLEICPGGLMPINGPVFSNAGIWAGSSSVTFNSAVIAVNEVYTNVANPFVSGKVGSGPSAFALAGQPVSHASAFKVPGSGFNGNPTNAKAILNLPPPAYAMGTANAYSTNGMVYLANDVDLVISNSVSGTNSGLAIPLKGTNLFVYYQDATQAPCLTPLTPDFYIVTNAVTQKFIYTNYISPTLLGPKTNIYYAGWTFVTNCTFYDYREGDTVQAVQIDIGKFKTWLTNITVVNSGYSPNNLCNYDKGHTIDSVWIYNNVPRTYSTLPAVRVFNGIQLPNLWGFTLVTPMPLYVYGDYNKQIDSTHVTSGTNTTYSYPAALMGDAITVLSANWSDSYNSSTPLPSRVPVATTINAAMLEGIVPSTNINGTLYYSGGVENFMRLAENWNPGTPYALTYNGSIVVMFPSIYATNYWNNAAYTIPTRNWGFDYNFLQQTKLPPLTPTVVNYFTP